MNQESGAILVRLLRANDLEWVIAPSDEAIPHLLRRLHEVTALYRSRVGVGVSFAPETLEFELSRNPHKVRAFLQAFGATRSPEMLVMVWRIMQGLGIREVMMAYKEQDSFKLQVVLARPGGTPDQPDQLERYQSYDIDDVAMLRHFGFVTMNDRPLFDGFYPLRLRDDPK